MSKPKPAPKAARPETPGQARAWEKTKTRYLRAGLCHACAAQAAWGHQLGFAYRSDRNWPEEDRAIKPPCEKCAPIVEEFPAPAAGSSGWRKLPPPAHSRDRLCGKPEGATALPGT